MILEASSSLDAHGPFDLVLVEGSVSTPEHIEEIRPKVQVSRPVRSFDEALDNARKSQRDLAESHGLTEFLA